MFRIFNIRKKNSRCRLNVYIMVLFLKMLVSLDIIEMKYTYNGNADRGNPSTYLCLITVESLAEANKANDECIAVIFKGV